MLIKEENAKRKSLTALNLYKVVALISINLSIHIVKTMQCSFIFDHFQISFVTYLNINVSRLSWKNLNHCVFLNFICTFDLWYDKWYICQFVYLCFFVHVLTLSYVYKTLKKPN